MNGEMPNSKTKKKKSLCETCKHGIVREMEHTGGDTTMDVTLNRCLVDNSFVDVVTKCNRYFMFSRKITYSDPDFEEYEKKTK